MHRNLRMTISTFDADGPITERSALGGAGDDSDVFDHGQNDNAAVLRKAFAIVSKLFVTCFAVLPDSECAARLSMMHAVSTRAHASWIHRHGLRAQHESSRVDPLQAERSTHIRRRHLSVAHRIRR